MESSRVGSLQLQIQLVCYVPIRDIHPPHMVVDHILSISNSEPAHNIVMLILRVTTTYL